MTFVGRCWHISYGIIFVLTFILVSLSSFSTIRAEIPQIKSPSIQSETYMGVGQNQRSSLGFARNMGSLMFLDLKYHRSDSKIDIGIRTAASGIQHGKPGFDYFRLGFGPVMSVAVREDIKIGFSAGYYKETALDGGGANLVYNAKGFYQQISWQKGFYQHQPVALFLGGFLSSFQGQLVSRGDALMLARFPKVSEQSYHSGLEKGVTFSVQIDL